MVNFPNFELSEFLTSETARKKRIDNFPTWDAVENLTELVSTIIQPLRTAWGSGIRVNSGYRSKALNNAIKGSSATSVHMIGAAADLWPVNGLFESFCLFTKDFLMRNDIPFDQLLIESSGKDRWLHIGLKSNLGEQRRQIKTLVIK